MIFTATNDQYSQKPSTQKSGISKTIVYMVLRALSIPSHTISLLSPSVSERA
jgi:hypothetical protein